MHPCGHLHELFWTEHTQHTKCLYDWDGDLQPAICMFQYELYSVTLVSFPHFFLWNDTGKSAFTFGCQLFCRKCALALFAIWPSHNIWIAQPVSFFGTYCGGLMSRAGWSLDKSEIDNEQGTLPSSNVKVHIDCWFVVAASTDGGEKNFPGEQCHY